MTGKRIMMRKKHTATTARKRFSLLEWARYAFLILSLSWLFLIYTQHSIVTMIRDDYEEKNQRDTASSTSHHAQFNNMTVRLHLGSPSPSEVRCLHTDATNATWPYRSCKFTNLCFDIKEEDFVVFDAPKIATTVSSVSLGGINPRWYTPGPDRGAWKLEWFPRIVQASTVESFYVLDNEKIFVPFHSLAGHNVGHLIWDDFYPIFSLLRIFGLVPKHNKSNLALIRQRIKYDLYANCDIRRNKRIQCKMNFERFLPLMGVDPQTFSTSKQYTFHSVGARQSRYVCAKIGLAGLGMLTDHGNGDHGWNQRTLDHVPHNLGRSSAFYEFRNFVVGNMMAEESRKPDQPPLVVLSQNSSRDWDRRHDFMEQARHLQEKLHHATVELRTLYSMTIPEQVELMSRARVLVTAVGGGSMGANFMPKGATLILYYNPHGGFDFETFRLTNTTARLDWDLLTNAGHLKVHWLPIDNMDAGGGIELLHALIEHELTMR